MQRGNHTQHVPPPSGETCQFSNRKLGCIPIDWMSISGIPTAHNDTWEGADRRVGREIDIWFQKETLRYSAEWARTPYRRRIHFSYGSITEVSVGRKKTVLTVFTAPVENLTDGAKKKKSPEKSSRPIICPEDHPGQCPLSVSDRNADAPPLVSFLR